MPSPLRFARALACGLALVIPHAALGAQADRAARLERAFSAIARQLQTMPAVPGFVVGITDRQRTLRTFAHGYADAAARAPATDRSRFAIGSISKSFTAIALMQLADEQRFDPDTPVTSYLPWFEFHSSAPITGHHLLTHTAGLPNYRSDLASMPYVVQALRDFEPTYAPGAHFWYSNIGFQVLGYVLEKIDDAPYHSIIERRLFAPLGMRASAATINDALRPALSKSYDRSGCDSTWVEAPWFEYRAADGSITSTVGDMLAYARLLLGRGTTPDGKRVFSERAFTRLTTPAAGSGELYAYGLDVQTDSGGVRLAHDGSIAGFMSTLTASLGTGVGIVILANGDIAPHRLSGWVDSTVTAALRGQPLPPPPKSPSPEERRRALAKYAGDYTSSSGARARVTVANAGLRLERDGKTLPLRQLNETTFCSTAPGFDEYPLSFERGDSGTVSLTHGPDVFRPATAARSQAPSAPAEYETLVGRYENHNPESAPLRVFVRGGELHVTYGFSRARRLVAAGPRVFRLAEPEYNPERLSFDAPVGGHSLRLFYTGMPMYRVDDR